MVSVQTQWLQAMCDWVSLVVSFSQAEAYELQQQLHGDGLYWDHCTQCNQTISSSASLPCWKEDDTLTLSELTFDIYDQNKEFWGVYGEPMCQMRLSLHTSTLLWPTCHNWTAGLALCRSYIAVSWYPARCSTFQIQFFPTNSYKSEVLTNLVKY